MPGCQCCNIYASPCHCSNMLSLSVPIVQTLLEHLGDIERAFEYAGKIDEASVWSQLGHAQLTAGLVGDAIASYLKAVDSTAYVKVWQPEA